MNGFYVLEVRTCPICQGYGYIEHPDWCKFRKAFPKFTKKDVLAYFGTSPPKREMTCSKCKGDGHIKTHIPLEVALERIGR